MPHDAPHRRFSAGGSYLKRRGNGFIFRARVPLSLVELIGQSEIARSLGTGDARVARYLAAALGVSVDRLWERLSGLEAMGDGKVQNEAARLLDLWFRTELDRVWRLFRSGALTDKIAPPAMDAADRAAFDRRAMGEVAEHRLDAMRRERAESDFSYGYPVARQVVAGLDAPFDEHDHRFTLLAAEAMGGEAAIEEARIRWAAGDYTYRPGWRSRLDTGAFPTPTAMVKLPEYVAPPAGPVPAPAPSKPVPEPVVEGPTLEEAVADHLRAVKRQANPTVKELAQRESHLRALVDAFGKDRRLVSISRQDAGRFFKAMCEMPTHADTRKQLAGLGFFARSAKAKDLGLPAMHGRTVNSYVGDARGLFADAVKEGLLERNPFDGMNVREQGFTENEAKPWKAHQQAAFFALPLFHGCRGERAVFEPGTHLLNDWRFWTPLIAATAGARVGEIAQLRPEDVRCEDGIWYLDISAEGGRRIKNRASKRRTPIHSQLVRIGLPQLAEARLKAGADRLLPSVPAPINGSASQGLTQWFREKAAKHIPDKETGQGWHSWRHVLQDLSRAAGNPDSVTDRIAGRTPEGSGGRYGAFGLPMLRDALERITFPDWLAAVPARR